MKKLSLLIGLVSIIPAGAQSYHQDCKNSEMLLHSERHAPCRHEIIIPQVNGYNVYKADLHTHTVFSDAQVLPKYRVNEAWKDGLDVMAVTEHIEYRPTEETFLEYLNSYMSKKYDSAINNRLVDGNELTKGGIMVDLNFAVKESIKATERIDLLIIPGSEITRSGDQVGHFNALFTTDNNLIYDPDPVQAIRNAKAQGALVLHNHPGWIRKNIDFTPAEKVAYAEGLIDGVEVMNASEFYPGVIDRVQKYGLFISANTDIHTSTAEEYNQTGAIRPMTLILAKEKTLESIREALENNRTIAYGFNTLCGEEQLLKDFFKAGVVIRVLRKDDNKNYLALTNLTSVPYTVRQKGHNQKRLDPFCTISFSCPLEDTSIGLEVLNMFYSSDKHPVVELSF